MMKELPILKKTGKEGLNMRVTTQMLNASAARAGMPTRTSSLLDYIGTEDTGNALLNALNGTSSTDTTSKRKYEDIEEAASDLLDITNVFLSEEEENIFTKATENPEELYDSIGELVDDYNEMIEKLKKLSTPLNSYYQDMLQEAVVDSKAELEAMGITQATDGTLKLNEEKMKEVEIDTIKETLGSSSVFGDKLAFIAGRIEDNAKANADSYSSQYDAFGNSYTTYSSKYNLWS